MRRTRRQAPRTKRAPTRRPARGGTGQADFSQTQRPSAARNARAIHGNGTPQQPAEPVKCQTIRCFELVETEITPRRPKKKKTTRGRGPPHADAARNGTARHINLPPPAFHRTLLRTIAARVHEARATSHQQPAPVPFRLHCEIHRGLASLGFI